MSFCERGCASFGARFLGMTQNWRAMLTQGFAIVSREVATRAQASATTSRWITIATQPFAVAAKSIAIDSQPLATPARCAEIAT